MLSRELKIGIIGGVISSVLVIIFIQPLLGFIWSAVLAFGESVQAGYVDGIYRNAAVGERNMVGHLSLLGVTFLLTFVPLLLLLPGMEKRGAGTRLPFPLIRILLAAVSVLIPPLFLVAASLLIGVSEINASFSQRLTVLTPTMNDQEVKEWRARWAKMQSQKDYRELVEAMERRANELRIELPKIRTP
ncbi:MAG: hypothetical protein ACLGJD_00315 [Gammaproteobacteria bacterium]|uniref:hypothetical protein n=1 Tax=Pseudacidovorax sp. 1753 TaxID=3156419 RepID=UPI0033951295